MLFCQKWSPVCKESVIYFPFLGFCMTKLGYLQKKKKKKKKKKGLNILIKFAALSAT